MPHARAIPLYIHTDCWQYPVNRLHRKRINFHESIVMEFRNKSCLLRFQTVLLPHAQAIPCIYIYKLERESIVIGISQSLVYISQQILFVGISNGLIATCSSNPPITTERETGWLCRCNCRYSLSQFRSIQFNSSSLICGRIKETGN